MFKTGNPATLEPLESYDYFSPSEIEKRLSVKLEYSQERNIRFLQRLAEELRKNKQKLAIQAALEMGKPLAEGLSEIEKCAVTCEYYVQNTKSFLQEQVVDSQRKIIFNPLGTLFAIMPWNFPYWQVLRFAAPALAAGNSILMKHSDLTAGCADLLESVFEQACDGQPWLQNMRVNHEMAAKIIADPRIKGVTFTGSSRGGREVAAIAGAALKKTVLELGGNDAYLVFADADVGPAAEICAKARLVNNGQSCVAGKRFLVHESIYSQFLEKFCQELSKPKQGLPTDEKTMRGPLAALKFKTQLLEQVQSLVQAGAQRHWRGETYTSQGAYVPAEVLELNESVLKSFSEEIFGPVAMVYKFKTPEQALRMANRSVYGLGGAIFSKNLKYAQEMAQKMECGFVAINDFVRSDPRVPFGGVKDSGYGRELGRIGMMEFVNTKTVTS